MTEVWNLQLPDSQKIVLLALADTANDEGHCWPSMASLARKCSKGQRTVQGVIKTLVAAGHVTRREVAGRGCEYWVHPVKEGTPAKAAPPQNLRRAANAPRNRRGGPPQSLRDTPAAAADKPSENHQEPSLDASHPRDARPADKPGESKPAKAKPEVPDWMPAEPWNGYLEMRKRIGKAPTDRAIELMIGKLERWRAEGHEPGAILDTATEHNWTGLYEPKEPRNAKRNDGSPDDWRGSARSHAPDRRDGFTRSLDETIAGGRASCAPVG
ncbi:hypothetical protein ADT71_03795 [Novosphingobium sp. ST904]|nr:hypothetical protein ADT71_03795 [Novosphingobium sp. ST904]TCM39131.1 helix-turn-helix protein [Novosphingobium sp. ST904]